MMDLVRHSPVLLKLLSFTEEEGLDELAASLINAILLHQH